MKKYICLVMTLCLLLVCTACSNGNMESGMADGNFDPLVSGSPNAGNMGDSSNTADTNDSSNAGTTIDGSQSNDKDTLDPISGEKILSDGLYVAYDRFSGESISNFYIKVHDSNSSQLIFAYSTSAGYFDYVVANLDASYNSTVQLNDTVTLNITVSGATIKVDEIEGLGAMAYDFRYYG